MFQQLAEGFREWLIPSEERQLPEKDRQGQRQLNDISLEFAHKDLYDATDGFRPENKLGSGAAGSVFRGTLRGGTEVAVKVLLDNGELGGFEEEVRVLSRFRHPNLVTLLGWGANKDEKYLVYELLAGGDAGVRLEQAREGKVLFPWQQRLQIALDAASGLSHLMNSTPKAFHRDIKPANILLDQAGTAKMADFGLAGTLKDAGRMHLTVENISGTPGYACPIYIQSGHVTEQSEVYSFGTVLLELIINRPPALSGPTGDIIYPLLETVQPAAAGANERVMKNMDPTAGWPHPIADQFGSLALSSVDMTPDRRPLFGQIVQVLRQLCANAGLGDSRPQPVAAAGRGYAQEQCTAQLTAPQPLPHAHQCPAGTRSQPRQLAELVLSCVSARGVDPSTLAPTERSIGFKVDFSGGHWVAAVGRDHQEEFFRRLVPKESAYVSRTHFELVLESPESPLMLRKISRNPLFLDDRPLPQGASVEVKDQAQLSFKNERDAEPYFMVLCVRCRSRDQVSREGPHPSVLIGSAARAAPVGRSPGGAAPATHVPAGTVALECVKTVGADLQSLSWEDRSLVLPLDRTLEVGRQHQVSLFEKLLEAHPSWMHFISRAHLRVTGQQGSASFQVENLSSNPVKLQGRLLMKGQMGDLSEGCRLIFVAKVQDQETDFLEFILRQGKEDMR